MKRALLTPLLLLTLIISLSSCYMYGPDYGYRPRPHYGHPHHGHYHHDNGRGRY